jgi:zinc-ribbon domain
MLFCTQCGSAIQDSHQYCGKCGKQIDSSSLVPRGPRFQRIPNKNPETVGSIGRFSQLFGLDPRIAFLTLIVDMMLNAGELISMGLLLPVSVAAGVVLGYVVYRAQINWYGDDKESARIKALVLGLLTAIPTPIPEILYIPAGILGLFHGFRRNWRKESHT